MKRIIFLLLLCLAPVFAYAGEAKDLAEDPVVEKRMVKLAENLRCLVCQNESLASSHAELAEDLRKEVREMIKKGLTDQQIKDYLVARYGDYVLFDPPMKRYTILLWFGPFAMLLLGGGVLFYQLRKRRKSAAESSLSQEAEQRAAALLNNEINNQT
ncbi:MAG: cytochrome c-type biogenesis protein [Gallionellaceae bacterium]|jgi:cytochrome c-type biogenesis protein CcmH